MEKQKKVTEVAEIKTVEEEKEKLPTVESETIEEEIIVEKKDNIFKKLGTKIKTNYNDTKHKLYVNKQINAEFKKDASHYILLDTFVKGTVRLLLQRDEENKIFIHLGNLKLNENSIIKNKDGGLFKIISKVEGEHTREFMVEEEKQIRVLTKYNYVEI